MTLSIFKLEEYLGEWEFKAALSALLQRRRVVVNARDSVPGRR